MESRNQEIIDQENIFEEAESNSASFEEQEISKPQPKRSKNPFKSPLFTKGFWCLIIFFCCSAFIYILSRFNSDFAEFWTVYPAQALRFILAKLSGWVPFSLAECLLLLLPILAITYIIASTISTKRDESDENFCRWLRPLISTILVISTIFFSGFGPAYGRKHLSDNLGLEQEPVSAKQLYNTGVILIEEVSEDIKKVEFDPSGASIMPYDYDTLKEKVNEAFGKYAKDADYISHFRSNPKAIALSKPMTYTHISGVYTFMTGESNINTNYPDFLVPFTMAHEMAHQRGIAREDEANFVAFLVCIGSDDAYIRYCGYANMLHYINGALSTANTEKSVELYYQKTPIELRKEFAAYSLFFDEYRDSTASEVTGAVNNTFLQSQGQSAGTKSYGLVVDLAVAYYKGK